MKDKKKVYRLFLLFTGIIVLSFCLCACSKSETSSSMDVSNKTMNSNNSSSGNKKTNSNNNEKHIVNDDKTTYDPNDDILFTVEDNLIENVSYVMIYNPLVCREVYDGKTGEYSLSGGYNLSTGDFSKQILTGMNKGGLKLEPELNSDLKDDFYIDISDLDLSQTEVKSQLDPVYSYGDTAEFFIEQADVIKKEKLTCVYKGEYCYVWTFNNAISDEEAQKIGTGFDEVSYPTVVEQMKLKKPRFTSNKGKVNIFVYDFEEENLLGFFRYKDIYSEKELGGKNRAIQYQCNTNHAIIHISKTLAEDITKAKMTMAHELQHLIQGGISYKTNYLASWLDEMMSEGASAEACPGEYFKFRHGGYHYYASEGIRKGLSLYSFESDFEYGNDGVYPRIGMLYNYLGITNKELAVKIHKYWEKASDDKAIESIALYSSVDTDFYNFIDSVYKYHGKIEKYVGSKEDIWLSKMTLGFYARTIEYPDQFNAEGYEGEEFCDRLHAEMLYTEKAPVNIQPGGRIIVATANGSYKIPDDADPLLVYMGFDENFNAATLPIMAK